MHIQEVNLLGHSKLGSKASRCLNTDNQVMVIAGLVKERLIGKHEGKDLLQLCRHDCYQTPSYNYSLKLICRGGKPWDTWKFDDNMEFCRYLGEYHEHIDLQIHLNN
jgi:hypothetical protein